MTKQHKIYMASPWFSAYESDVEEALYGFLKMDSSLNVYSPRRDGTKLEPGEFHDHEKRKLVFADNTNNIDDAKLVIANVDSYEGHLDQGTVWEIGYALTKGVPVILYNGLNDSDIKPKDVIEKIYKVTPDELFGFNLEAELHIANSLKELKEVYSEYLDLNRDYKEDPMTLLVVGPSETDANIEVLEGIKGLLFSKNIAYVSIDELRKGDNKELTDLFSSAPITTLQDYISEVDGVIAVIDDRNPLVSMVMGAAYALNKPMISFTNFDYGVNLMLMLSIARHVKGLDELAKAIEVVLESGFDALGEQNSEGVRVI